MTERSPKALDELLAMCKELDAAAWPEVSMEEFLSVEPDAGGRRLVHMGKTGMRRYNAARTLLPGLAEMLEAAIDPRDWPRHDELNRLAADLLAKLEAKEKDDVVADPPADPAGT